LLVEPLFEAMQAPNKGVQLGAAMYMVKMVECAAADSVWGNFRSYALGFHGC